MFNMSEIIFQVGNRVKYTGANNLWTFNEDLVTNAEGLIIEVLSDQQYRILFDNGIETVMTKSDLQIV